MANFLSKENFEPISVQEVCALFPGAMTSYLAHVRRNKLSLTQVQHAMRSKSATSVYDFGVDSDGKLVSAYFVRGSDKGGVNSGYQISDRFNGSKWVRVPVEESARPISDESLSFSEIEALYPDSISQLAKFLHKERDIERNRGTWDHPAVILRESILNDWIHELSCRRSVSDKPPYCDYFDFVVNNSGNLEGRNLNATITLTNDGWSITWNELRWYE
jgi:hypothetical protein